MAQVEETAENIAAPRLFYAERIGVFRPLLICVNSGQKWMLDNSIVLGFILGEL